MDWNTGKLYEGDALRDLLRDADEGDPMAQKKRNRLVMMDGTPEHVHSIADAVKAQRRRENKKARKSRKKNH